MFKYNKLSGFALFETAVSLLVASSFVTTYNSQVADKKIVDDVLTFSQSSQQAVSNFYRTNGILPTNNSEAKLPIDIKHPSIANLEIGEFGEITITLSNNLNSLAEKTIILEPKVVNNEITWSCGSGSLENQYRPTSCYKRASDNQYIELQDDSNMYDFIEEANYL